MSSKTQTDQWLTLMHFSGVPLNTQCYKDIANPFFPREVELEFIFKVQWLMTEEKCFLQRIKDSKNLL